MTQRPHFSVDYNFWSVGQGLFASGVLNDEKSGKRFHWVYDCGTTSGKKYLNKALKRYKEDKFRGHEKSKIDLVVISHFDADHISGIVDLLSKFSVQTLLLPYMPLWQRLLIAFESGVDSQQSVMRFYVDPVGFLNDAGGGGKVERIVFVSTSGEGPPIADGDQVPGLDGLVLNGRVRDVDPEDEDVRSLNASITGAKNNVRPQVQFLSSQSNLVVWGLWEFVPYNETGVKTKATAVPFSAFKKQVAECRRDLLASPTDAVLGKLKDLYDARFGKIGLARNLISLFMYAGPISSSTVAYPPRHAGVLSSRNERRYFFSSWAARSAVLYTGDGYLNSPKRFDALKDYLQVQRMSNVSCLQVMHHGAEGNWHEGLAKKFSPDISVFSSDPEHKGFGHPHGCVVRDFLKYSPVQVDKADGLEIRIS
jgi:beta-lactamase superfamily II metal-dependent hydrolase